MQNLTRTKKAGGFSLIELSLTLVIVSSLAVVMITKLSASTDNRKQKTSVEDLKLIKTAIDEYVKANNYYPCPADPTLPQGNAFYSVGKRTAKGNCDITGMMTNAAILDDNTKLGTTYTDTGSNAVEYALASDIIQGTIPCRDIGLPEDCLLDPYGNRYAYAVIPELAKAASDATITTFKSGTACNKYIRGTSGVVQEVPHIRMLKSFRPTASLQANYNISANRYDYEPDYVIIYYGKDGIGAYSEDGSQRNTPFKIDAGVYAGDNALQEINHHLHPIMGAFDQYYLMPVDPLGPGLTFGDIIMFGKNDSLREHICIKCQTSCVPPKYIYNVNEKLKSADADMPVSNIYCPGCTDVQSVCAAAKTAGLCVAY